MQVNHLGAKISHTTCTFNLTCNHRCRILHTTHGGPGRWNDQTIVRSDTFLTSIRDGRILTNNEFDLLSYENEGSIISIWYKGAYVIVDSGDWAWSCTIPPFLVTNKIEVTRLSRWVESIWKDVECTFKILKGRWRILKSGVCANSVDKVDEICLTCCALHNLHLEVDKLSCKWNDGVLVSNYDGELGQMNFGGLRESIPNLIARISINLDPHNYDLSDMRPGKDVVGEVYLGDRCKEEEIDIGIQTPVNSMLLGFFCHQLVIHFTIMFSQNLIK
jgi:hypothetical protein